MNIAYANLISNVRKPNKFKFIGNTVHVLLERQDGTMLTAVIDRKNFDTVARYRWCASQCRHSGRFYAATAVRDAVTGKRRSIHMQALLFGSPGLVVDHVRTSATLLNTEANCRLITSGQNTTRAARKVPTKTTIYRGIYKDKGRWVVRIVPFGGKVIFGGYYECEVSAARRYDELAKQHHAEFAVLNFGGIAA